MNSGGLPSPQAGFGRITIHPKLVFREVGKLDVSFDDCWMEYIRCLTPLRRRLNTSYHLGLGVIVHVPTPVERARHITHVLLRS